MADGWFIKRGKERQGPLSGEQLLALAAKGELQPTDRIARKGMAKWVEARSFDGLFPETSAAIAAEIVPSPPKKSEPPIVEATAVEEVAAVTPAEKPSAIVRSGRTALPWILAAGAGGGVLVVGCSGLLCTGLFFFSGGSTQQQAAPSNLTVFSAPDNVGEAASPPAELSVAASSAQAQPSGELDLDALNELLDRVKERAAGGAPNISPEIAAVVAKAEEGNVESMYELGYRYSEGDGVAVDDAVAVGWLQKAADGGNVDAMNDLAYMYAKGRGVEQDVESAAAWFGKGAESGSGMAMFNYAICLGHGTGVPENQYLCQLWVRKSAETGYEPAQQYLRQAQAEAQANLVGALLGGIFGGGGDEEVSDSDRQAAADDEYWTRRRQQQDYWGDRARRAEAAGDHNDAEYSRNQIP